MTAEHGPPFLTARWTRLAMLNYEVDPGILRELVPTGTELDLWHGRCFVSVVGFQFLDTRVLGLAIPFHRDFQEVNLRFYVRRIVRDEIRRGVVFVKEIVPRRALAWMANALYHEKYVAMPMSHVDATQTEARSLAYEWLHDGASCRLAAVLDGDARLPDATSEEAFITEHYWGYTRRRDGGTLEYRVEHPRWRVWNAREPELRCDVARLYGSAFAAHLTARPSSSFVADGSEVLVRRALLL
jgi:uncharacterized protein YqjF (DUF2071 family)